MRVSSVFLNLGVVPVLALALVACGPTSQLDSDPGEQANSLKGPGQTSGQNAGNLKPRIYFSSEKDASIPADDEAFHSEIIADSKSFLFKDLISVPNDGSKQLFLGMGGIAE